MTARRVMENLGAALVVLVIAGCSTVAPKEEGTSETPAYHLRAVKQKDGFTLKEDTKIDSAVEADFESAMEALEAGKIDKGISLLEKVIKTSPNATAPYINLAIAYKKINKLEKAEESLKKALALSPEHPVANNEYGILLRRTGRFAEAKAMYEKVLNRYPGYVPARKNLGVLCDLFLKDLECALENYQIYNKAVPEDKPVAIWIADIEIRLGKR